MGDWEEAPGSMRKVHSPEESLTKRQRPEHGIINLPSPCTSYNHVTTRLSFSKRIMSGFQPINISILKGNEHRYKRHSIKTYSDIAGSWNYQTEKLKQL